MPPPSNLPAALLRQAALGREEPWLFHAEGWDWRWHSWGELVDRMLLWTEVLASIPSGSRVAFPYVPRPAEVVLDLAIQAAGLVSVPVSERREEREAAFWIEIVGGEVRITEASPPDHRREWRNEAGTMVIQEGEAIEWTPADLIRAAERLREKIQGREGEREIVVLGGPLEDPAERAMMAWATVAGAAVVLEPNPALRVATAAWVRPTVFHGTRDEIGGLRKWVDKEKRPSWRRGPRLPFRRLRSVLVTGRESLAAEEEAFWRERGVRMISFPTAGT